MMRSCPTSRPTAAHWDELAAGYALAARHLWAQPEPTWGNWHAPQSQVPMLPSDLDGLDVLELGCGTGYVSSWVARAGGHPVGLDNSARQLATARQMQREFELDFPLLHADAERVPLVDARFDLVISEYGASIWCDPYRWVPEAARLLRPGGRLVFLRNSTLSMLCVPDVGVATDRLLRPQAGLHRMSWESDPGVEFHLGHGDWIRLLRTSGFEIEDLIEIFAPDDATDDAEYLTVEWARQWPVEEAWFARRRRRLPRPQRSRRKRSGAVDQRQRPQAALKVPLQVRRHQAARLSSLALAAQHRRPASRR